MTLPLYNFIDVKDPRFLKTLEVIERELTVSEGLLLRYKDDFLGSVRHPFTLVSTWLARVYIKLNQISKARRIIDKLIKCSTDSLLLGEHIDQNSCEPRVISTSFSTCRFSNGYNRTRGENGMNRLQQLIKEAIAEVENYNSWITLYYILKSIENNVEKLCKESEINYEVTVDSLILFTIYIYGEDR